MGQLTFTKLKLHWDKHLFACIHIYTNVNLTRITGVTLLVSEHKHDAWLNRRQPRSRGPFPLWRRKTQFAPRIELWLVNFNFSRVHRMPGRTWVLLSSPVIYRSEKFWLWRQRTSVQTLGEGEGSPKATSPAVENAIFLGGKSRGAFGQPRFSWRQIA